MQGWIKLHRKSLESAAFHNPKTWKVFCWALMRANHTETKISWNGNEVVLKAGQFISGRFKGSHECYMKPSTFRNQVALLKKLGNLDTKTDRQYTLFTIINWDLYQLPIKNQDSEKDNQRTTRGHRQECKNEENVVVQTSLLLSGRLKELDIEVPEEKLKARMNKLLKEYDKFTLQSSLEDAVSGWSKLSVESRGNFLSYWSKVLHNDYSKFDT